MSNPETLHENAQMALDTILRKPTQGIPSFIFHVLKHAYIERLAGVGEGDYRRDPVNVYRNLQENVGTCIMDQWIPTNPLSMTDHGYDEDTAHSATTGAEQIVCDGIHIADPDNAVEHLERVDFPRLQAAIRDFDEVARVQAILADEAEVQRIIGPTMLKTGYGFAGFPSFYYDLYGYVNYFSAYGLYPEVMERHFALQADYWVLNNRAAARAYREGGLPPIFRLDHDMTDSRGPLVDIRSLERIWFPHFIRAIEPLVKQGVTLVWHSDGNVMPMVPGLLAAGVGGFQGFQHECSMDFPRLSAMKTRDGRDLVMFAGLSSTDGLLRLGTPQQIRDRLKWLVANGPRTGLFLSAMGIYPDMPWENVQTYVEGIRYYRKHGRD